ncbi:hypothetical protein C5167_038238 [Papaver somniferum]|uniref:TF-B3 domain-containing protein n=1 Tax=Papaver somniferum TaxID=3469 RepID=A0A4Y7ICR6_PAPSO|nr:B3 domain-containing transcription factor VRN1-like [Papaver somniferum]RZC45288.1 hypothetical protein C5167_038238 [Papaver somniferum]
MASRFFSIVHAAIIEKGELALPKRFVGKFRTELSDVAVITIPNGQVWRVQLREAKGEILFGSGWKDFMDYFPLAIGHFLILRYDGNSRFHIFVCDMSATEIKYPLHSSNVEISSHTSVFSASTTEETDYVENSEILCPCPISRIPLPASRHIPLPAKKERKSRAERETNVFKSQSGNLTFKIVMQPAYVREGRTVVHVPVGFKAFREVDRDIATLRDSEGRTWDVGISTYREKHTKLVTGWSDFVLDNRLEVGDVCIFELIDRDNLQIDVTIMRAQDVV